jgi:hypothetical protein
MKIINIILALKDQGPTKRFIRNLCKGHILGLINKRSHHTSNGNTKVMYNTKKTATNAAESMSKKTNKYFSNYKCLYCDGYHIGKNSENK